MATNISNPKAGGSFSGIAKPVPLVVTGDTGTIAKGFRSLGVINRSTTTAATINGITIAPGEAQNYPYVGFQYDNDMAYDCIALGSVTLAIIVVY